MTLPPDGAGSTRGRAGRTTGALLREGAELLLAAGSETPRLDAEVLLGHAVGVGRTVVLAHPEAPVGADAARRYRADLERRATGEPVAYLRGIKEFYGLAFEADARALIPRPETELLVELARPRSCAGSVPSPDPSGRRRSDRGRGTGSGAIAVALAVSLRRLRALEAVEISRKRNVNRYAALRFTRYGFQRRPDSRERRTCPLHGLYDSYLEGGG